MDQDSPGTVRQGQRGPGLSLVIVLGLVVTLLHGRAFFVRHDEGDEMAFLALSSEMHWDLGHYTTKDHRLVKHFPWKVYQAPLFIHPPLFPYLLKIVGTVMNRVLGGLLIELAACWLWLWLLWRAGRRFALDPPARYVLLIVGSMCPLLLMFTSKLHLDGLLAVAFFGGILWYIEALEDNSLGKGLVAGLFLAAACNLKFTAYAFLPLLPLIHLLHLWRQARGEAGDCEWAKLLASARRWRHWRVTALVGLLVVTVGLQHLYRLLIVYHGWSGIQGIIWGVSAPGVVRHVEFTRHLAKAGRQGMLGYLLAVYPLLLLLLMPAAWWRLAGEWRERSWLLAIVACVVYLFALMFKYQYSQMRYFLPCFPFAYVWLAATLSDRQRGIRLWEWSWLGFGLLLMVTTGFVNTNLLSPSQVRVMPSLFYLLPFLWQWYV